MIITVTVLSVNILAVMVAAISGFVEGALWNSPLLFGNPTERIGSHGRLGGLVRGRIRGINLSVSHLQGHRVRFVDRQTCHINHFAFDCSNETKIAPRSVWKAPELLGLLLIKSMVASKVRGSVTRPCQSIRRYPRPT
jgi:hypothetical protein